MRTVENQCVGCPSDLGCIGDACPHKNVECIRCDLCGDEAEYEVDGEELCESCAKKRIIEAFNDFDIFEQADMLDISLRNLS